MRRGPHGLDGAGAVHAHEGVSVDVDVQVVREVHDVAGVLGGPGDRDADRAGAGGLERDGAGEHLGVWGLRGVWLIYGIKGKDAGFVHVASAGEGGDDAWK